MKKYISIVLFFLAITTTANCQKVVEETTKISADDRISLDFQFADEIKVSTWNRNEVYVKANVSINNNLDNDAFRLKLRKRSGGVEIESIIDNMEKLQKTTIIQQQHEDDERTVTTHTLELDLFFEVKLPKNAKLSINTISGNVLIEGLRNEMEIETISGYVDLSLPSNQKADLVLNTITGEMYTDFDLNLKKQDGLHRYIKGKFTTALNGGGEEISLKTISGDIFLRKTK
ncbi:MAG: DUF4097 family beta strand repeat-containing protein [Marinifilaceae bacterium]